MEYQQYVRADGLVFLVSPDGQVYELRETVLDPALLPDAARAGFLTRLDDLSVPSLGPQPSQQRRRWGSGALKVLR